MKIIKSENLSEDFFAGSAFEGIPAVQRIMADVKKHGDWAVRHYTWLFDGVRTERLRISADAVEKAGPHLSESVRAALLFAARNVRTFAERQLRSFEAFEVEIVPGVFCGQRIVPIDRLGVYVPAGRFPLVSSLLMSVVPAQTAGVREIAVCSPPRSEGSVHPVVLAAAGLLGIEEVYAIGGAQAIAAMAYGTESVKKTDKIIGPGNRFVALAKKEAFGTVGVDMTAGPTEVMIVADQDADPEFIAADLLAQAEHDPEASAVLLTDSAELAARVREETARRIAGLPTQTTIASSIRERGLIVIVKDMDEAAEISNRKAPEHLELHIRNAEARSPAFRHYGTLFIGPWTAEVLGDFTSGLNHILPTGSSARFSSGLSVRDFLKSSTTLRVERGERADLSAVYSPARTLAECEGLAAHAAAAEARLNRAQSGRFCGKGTSVILKSTPYI